MHIGENLDMVHSFNTFLNGKSIDSRFRCYHNVTVGEKNGKLPIIGNNVVMGCGSSVLGGVIIGDNVGIGAGCVVVKNVPDNCIVVGNPARILRKDGERVNIIL